MYLIAYLIYSHISSKITFLIKMGDLKATTIKDAIKNWEDENKKSANEATNICLQFQWPPIEKMDNNLSVLTKCEKLSLNTNMIEKINGLAALRHLKILSLGRNLIKAFTGLEPLADTLEELWISYNFIEKMKGVLGMRKLKVLHMSNNNVKEWAEVNKLAEMESLKDFLFVGNPLCDCLDESVWRSDCIRKLPKLVILDGVPIIRD